MGYRGPMTTDRLEFADAVPSLHAAQQTAGKRTSRRREYAARVVGGGAAIQPAADGPAPDRGAVPAVGQIPAGDRDRAVPQRGGRLAQSPLPPARGDDRPRPPRHAGDRHARGPVPHRALRRARDRAGRGEAGRADAEPVLSRLCRRGGRGGRGAILPQRDGGERLLPRHRRDPGCDPAAHRARLHLLAREPSRVGRAACPI